MSATQEPERRYGPADFTNHGTYAVWAWLYGEVDGESEGDTEARAEVEASAEVDRHCGGDVQRAREWDRTAAQSMSENRREALDGLRLLRRFRVDAVVKWLRGRVGPNAESPEAGEDVRLEEIAERIIQRLDARTPVV